MVQNTTSPFSVKSTAHLAFMSDPVVIEDPFNMRNNVGRSCFGIRIIQALMREAYHKIVDGSTDTGLGEFSIEVCPCVWSEFAHMIECITLCIEGC